MAMITVEEMTLVEVAPIRVERRATGEATREKEALERRPTDTAALTKTSVQSEERGVFEMLWRAPREKTRGH